MSDPLLDAIVAAPDDDGPRLVWADREGGERGELVVLQCALARRDLPRDDRRRMIARERELLAQKRFEWSPLFNHGGPKPWLARADIWSGEFGSSPFVRGFVERAAVSLSVLADPKKRAALFSRAPLLRELQLFEQTEEQKAEEDRTMLTRPRRTDEENEAEWLATQELLAKALSAIPTGRRITLLETDAVHRARGMTYLSRSNGWVRLIASSPSLCESLTDLTIGSKLTAETIPDLCRLKALTRAAFNSDWSAVSILQLLRGLPSLKRLDFSVSDKISLLPTRELDILLNADEIRRVTELAFRTPPTDEGIEHIAKTPALSNLERLSFGWRDSKFSLPTIKALARSAHLSRLTDLRITHGIDDDGLTELAGATFAPRVRVLELVHCPITSSSVPRLVNDFPALEKLSVFGVHLPVEAIHELESIIPEVEQFPKPDQ